MINKIYNPNTTKIAPKPRTGVKPSTAEPKGFDNMLNKAMDPTSSKHPKPAVSGLPELRATRALNITPSIRPTFADGIEKAVGLLDIYTKELENPKVTLKNAAATLDRLIAQTELLENEVRGGAAKDPKLAAILKELSQVAQTEKIKILRGDYT